MIKAIVWRICYTILPITSICELLDGYTSDKLQLDLIDTKSNKSIKEGIQMHDICANYLRWEKPNKG